MYVPGLKKFPKFSFYYMINFYQNNFYYLYYLPILSSPSLSFSSLPPPSLPSLSTILHYSFLTLLALSFIIISLFFIPPVSLCLFSLRQAPSRPLSLSLPPARSLLFLFISSVFIAFAPLGCLYIFISRARFLLLLI